MFRGKGRIRGSGLVVWMILLAGASAAALGAEDLSDAEILRLADEARGNLEGVRWELEMNSESRGRVRTMGFDVQARGFNVFAKQTAPRKSRGKKLVILKENMWFYKPGLSKPVPISKRQKLLGNAAYGDIASTNYAEDYDPTRLEEEVVDGEPCFVFDLKARHKKTTYDRIRYWVSKERFVGVRGEYFTVSGKLFKSAVMEYANQVVTGDRARPFISRFAIRDELMDRGVTNLILNEPAFGPVPDHVFNINLLVDRL